jgi:hypothetical protein
MDLKTYTLTLLLFISFSATYAQNYFDYHKLVAKAENDILAGKNNRALHKFEKLFESYDFVYAIDYFTAAQLAATTEQSGRAINYLRKGITRGIRLKLITDNEILRDLQTHTEWKQFVLDYEGLRQIYLRSIDQKLCEKVKALFESDLLVTRDIAGTEKFSTSLVGIKHKKQIRRNGEALIDLILQHGFPGERLIGLEECANSITDEEEHIIGNNVMLNAKMVFMMLMHYYSEPNRDINAILYREVKKGNLPPDQYAIIQDYLTEWGNGRFGDYKYYNQSRTELENGEERAINERRSVIGLGTFNHKMAKRSRWLTARKNRTEGKTIYIRP